MSTKRHRAQIAVLAIVTLFIFFLFFQLISHFHPNAIFESSSSHSQYRNELETEFTDSVPLDASHLTELIIVTCHAIYHGPFTESDLSNESNWILESFQHGQTPYFIGHLKAGLALATANPSALLLFTGGQTRGSCGQKSEGYSYLEIAHRLHWIPTSVLPRITTEEFSKDSYENISYSLCRFKQVTRSYPKFVTAIGFAFKARRFTQLHFPAAGLSPESVRYLGIQDEKTDAIIDGPFAEFLEDPYGCSGSLADKRARRNPFKRQHGYEHSCPEMKELFSYCGKEFYSGNLPWRPLNNSE